MAKCEDNTKEPKKQDPSNNQSVQDVYLGVFFDGTNNNMVQKARFTGTGKNIISKGVQNIWYGVKKTVWYAIDKVTPWDEESNNVNPSEKFTERNPEERGYSNVAYLHDYCCIIDQQWKQKAGNCISKVFYIEGSGATDTSKFLPGNPNGLGFGLGDTGVTALVSKAVKYITNFVDSCNLDKENVNIHFYVYGFSRGSTCARLFSRLVTRGSKGGEIPREKEFSEHSAKNLYKNGRLCFLDNYPKKTVECLGIYDTVVSIGFLMQKDGQVHPYMRSLYNLGKNYKDNWHYLNVFDYGMSLNDEFAYKIQKIYHICAMDEFRENFALTDVGANVPSNAAEILVPGCHSDVGGGYLPKGEEQEIVLNKMRHHNHPVPDAGCINNADDIKTFVSLAPPLDPSIARYMDMSLEAIEQLGWITLKDDRNKKNKEKYTMRALDNKTHIKFKRNVWGVYSHITLKMMSEFSNKEASAPDAIFPTDANERWKELKSPVDLESMYNTMIGAAQKASFGKREWICPSENDYRKLRMKYIHFTCTSDENYHLNNPFNFKGVHTFEGTAGNLGNTPNFDLGGRLCRIVYHSDPQKPKRVDEVMHYMYEYGTTGKIHVECNVEL